MVMRALGRGEIQVSPLAVGCWSFGGGEYWGTQSQSDVEQVVGRALDIGINFFDTAEMYNDGASEIALGAALKSRRKEAVICSKVSPDHAYYDELIAHCEKSLMRLQTDYLDVYMLHWPLNAGSVRHFTQNPHKIAYPPTVQEAMDALQTLKEEGKIRLIGLSNFGVQQMTEVLKCGVDPAVNEMPYNIFSRAIERTVRPFCIERDISLMYSMALQQGLLTGKYTSADDVPAPQAHSRHFSDARGKGMSRHGGMGMEMEMFIALDKLRSIARENGLTLTEMAIAWTLHRPGAAATLVGCRTVKQLEENARATLIRLDETTVSRIDAASQPVWDKLGDDLDYYESAEKSRVY